MSKYLFFEWDNMENNITGLVVSQPAPKPTYHDFSLEKEKSVYQLNKQAKIREQQKK